MHLLNKYFIAYGEIDIQFNPIMSMLPNSILFDLSKIWE